jgi:hypothetical protein
VITLKVLGLFCYDIRLLWLVGWCTHFIL